MRARYYAQITGLVVLLSAGSRLAAQSTPLHPSVPPEVQRRQLERFAQAAARIIAKPKVTCGMTVVPADPKVDPKTIKPSPDQTTKHTIRQLPPGACR
jgi:hypothetical protein